MIHQILSYYVRGLKKADRRKLKEIRKKNEQILDSIRSKLDSNIIHVPEKKEQLDEWIKKGIVDNIQLDGIIPKRSPLYEWVVEPLKNSYRGFINSRAAEIEKLKEKEQELKEKLKILLSDQKSVIQASYIDPHSWTHKGFVENVVDAIIVDYIYPQILDKVYENLSRVYLIYIYCKVNKLFNVCQYGHTIPIEDYIEDPEKYKKKHNLSYLYIDPDEIHTAFTYQIRKYFIKSLEDDNFLREFEKRELPKYEKDLARYRIFKRDLKEVIEICKKKDKKKLKCYINYLNDVKKAASENSSNHFKFSKEKLKKYEEEAEKCSNESIIDEIQFYKNNILEIISNILFFNRVVHKEKIFSYIEFTKISNTLFKMIKDDDNKLYMLYEKAYRCHPFPLHDTKLLEKYGNKIGKEQLNVEAVKWEQYTPKITGTVISLGDGDDTIAYIAYDTSPLDIEDSLEGWGVEVEDISDFKWTWYRPVLYEKVSSQEISEEIDIYKEEIKKCKEKIAKLLEEKRKAEPKLQSLDYWTDTYEIVKKYHLKELKNYTRLLSYFDSAYDLERKYVTLMLRNGKIPKKDLTLGKKIAILKDINKQKTDVVTNIDSSLIDYDPYIILEENHVCIDPLRTSTKSNRLQKHIFQSKIDNGTVKLQTVDKIRKKAKPIKLVRSKRRISKKRPIRTTPIRKTYRSLRRMVNQLSSCNINALLYLKIPEVFVNYILESKSIEWKNIMDEFGKRITNHHKGNTGIFWCLGYNRDKDEHYILLILHSIGNYVPIPDDPALVKKYTSEYKNSNDEVMRRIAEDASKQKNHHKRSIEVEFIENIWRQYCIKYTRKLKKRLLSDEEEKAIKEAPENLVNMIVNFDALEKGTYYGFPDKDTGKYRYVRHPRISIAISKLPDIVGYNKETASVAAYIIKTSNLRNKVKRLKQLKRKYGYSLKRWNKYRRLIDSELKINNLSMPNGWKTFEDNLNIKDLVFSRHVVCMYFLKYVESYNKKYLGRLWGLQRKKVTNDNNEVEAFLLTEEGKRRHESLMSYIRYAHGKYNAPLYDILCPFRKKGQRSKVIYGIDPHTLEKIMDYLPKLYEHHYIIKDSSLEFDKVIKNDRTYNRPSTTYFIKDPGRKLSPKEMPRR